MSKVIADGSRVIGICQGNAVIGTVLSSRHYGKRLVYSVQLEEPISLRWRTESVYQVLLGNHEIKAAAI
jgi:hypothetical protein